MNFKLEVAYFNQIATRCDTFCTSLTEVIETGIRRFLLETPQLTTFRFPHSPNKTRVSAWINRADYKLLDNYCGIHGFSKTAVFVWIMETFLAEHPLFTEPLKKEKTYGKNSD